MDLLDLIIAGFPIGLLIFLMTMRNGMAANRALPLAALVLYGILLVYFRFDPVLVHAAVVEGLLTAMTPVAIVLGAVLLFKTMEHTGAMETVREWLNGISSNRVAQLMIVGWAFSYLVEGVSGFGTPAALVAPLLIGLGYAPLPVVILCLMMNTVPVSFGAVGMPTWFGFGGLGLTQGELREIGIKSALMHAGAASFIPLLALRVVVPWVEIRRNLGFIALVVAITVGTSVATAWCSVEFPSIVGGLCGLVAGVLAARMRMGLSDGDGAETASQVNRIGHMKLLMATFPIWGSVMVLLVTRLDALGLRAWLTRSSPALHFEIWGGEWFISPSLVVGWRDIFGTDLAWSHAILYVPSIVPFVIVSMIAFWGFRTPAGRIRAAWKESIDRVVPPLGAFIGALVFVKLLVSGGEHSAANVLGEGLANLVGGSWHFAAVYLGALGSFFSGSNTVSNLTFGGIQAATATELGLSRTTILSLQSVGGAMGNMICIHNIVAVCSVVGLQAKESEILRKTILPVMLYGVMAGLVAWFF